MVEGQEDGRRPLEPGRHAHVRVADGEVHQCPARKGQQWLGAALALGLGVPVKAVLVHRILDRLGEVRLQLPGGHADAVQEQHQVQAVLVVHRIADLAHHPQPVGLVAGFQLRVHAQGGLELGELQGLLEPQDLHPVAQHIQGAAGVDLLAHPIQQDGLCSRAVGLAQGLPRLGLALLDPSDQVRREQGAGPVVVLGIALRVVPAVRGEVGADVLLERSLQVNVGLVVAHRSIHGVVAAQIDGDDSLVLDQQLEGDAVGQVD